MQPLRIHCFQHVSFEGPGCIENWITEHGHTLTYSKFYEPYSIPDLDDIDWLIVMGGPMGVYDDHKYSWLKPEKSFIKQAINNNKIVLGICLGAQLIAQALGAEIFPNEHKEIGWFNVAQTNEGANNYLFSEFEPIFKVFHWHGDTFNIAAGTAHLLQSEACRNQAFLYKEQVLGLQFHFEITTETLKQMLQNGAGELIKDTYVQTESEILVNTELIEINNKRLYSILGKLAKNTYAPG